MRRARSAAAALVAVTVVLGGCVGVIDSVGPGGGGGTSTSGSGGGVPHAAAVSASTCALGIEVRSEIFIERCGACHGSTAPAAGLDLVSPGAVGRMIGTPAASCGGQTLVTADGAGGVLFDRVEGTACGRLMPLADAPLDRSELDCLYAYVAREAAAGP